MTVGAISSNGLSLSQLSQLNGTSQTQTASFCEAGQSSGVQGGGLFNAVVQSLQQIGAVGQTGSSSSSSSSDSSDSTSTQDPAQALASFMQSLMAALHAQNTSANNTSNDGGGSQGSGSTSGVSRGGGHHHHHMKADLNSLIQQVSSGSDSDSTASSTNATDASASATTDLESSFQNLMSSLGQSGSSADLNQFLKAFSGNVQDLGPAGNVVSTKA